MAFRGYVTFGGWARSKWRALLRIPGRLRALWRGYWWRATGYAKRLQDENDRLRAYAKQQHEHNIKLSNAAYYLKYPPAGEGQSLRLAADEVDRQGPASPCENAWMEGDTGAWNCDRERVGEICWCDVANDLRQIDKVLADCAELNLASCIERTDHNTGGDHLTTEGGEG